MTEPVEGMGTVLSRRGGKVVFGDLFSKITRLDLDGEKRKPLRDSQVEIELMVVWRILWTRWELCRKLCDNFGRFFRRPIRWVIYELFSVTIREETLVGGQKIL